MTIYNKLVRDKIPEMLDAKGVLYEKRIAEGVEFKVELIKKLGEEYAEFSEAGDPEELADLMEVVEALKKLPEYSEVESIRQKKLQERGGYNLRLILKGEK